MSEIGTADWYRRMAKEMLARAEGAPPGKDKDILLQIAQDYQHMARSYSARVVHDPGRITPMIRRTG